MSKNIQLFFQMADRTAEQITGSYQKWTAFLTTAARLYKYPYNGTAHDLRPAPGSHGLRRIRPLE